MIWYTFLKILILTSGLFYHNNLDQYISNKRGCLVRFIMAIFYRNSCTKCNQCRPWSDAVFGSGFALGLTWVYASRQCPIYGTLGVNGLNRLCPLTIPSEQRFLRDWYLTYYRYNLIVWYQKKTTVDSHYLEVQGTLWNSSVFVPRHVRFAELRKT